MRKFILVLTLIFSGLAAASPLHNIVVFGDSLSDNGNLYEYMKHQLPQNPPYYQGRFTNGPVWVELLTKAYFPTNSQEKLFDYAFGGAGVSIEEDEGGLFTLRKEVDSYLLAHEDKVDPNSLYIVWIGANNYLSLPDDREQAVHDVTLGIQQNLERLASKGAKTIMVMNLPDLGRTPLAEDDEVRVGLTQLAQLHNLSLNQHMVDLQAAYPGVKWVYVDVNDRFSDMLDNPATYGFTNTTGTCYEAAMDQHQDQPLLRMVAKIRTPRAASACDGYLFFDPVHPTLAAHRVMADYAKEILTEAGVELAD